MSWEATAYVKGLSECPDGAALGRGQKLLLFVLSDYHNALYRVAWPSVVTLAQEALTSLSQCKRDLAYLEEHQVIRRQKPEKFGAGIKYGYAFVELDLVSRSKGKGVQGEPLSEPLHESLSEPLSEPLPNGKGVQGEPFFSDEKRGPEGVHLATKRGSQRGSEGVHGAQRNKEEPEHKQKQPRTSTPGGAALKAWLEIKAELGPMLDEDEVKLWVRPAYLLKVMTGNQLLVALPPNGRVIEAAKKYQALLTGVARKHGYSGVSLTRYPDDYERERVRSEYPEFYAQMFGNRAAGEVSA